METLLPDPRIEYDALADALRIFHEYQGHPPPQVIVALQEAVEGVMEAWQRCEAHRATREKEFRYHVVKLKLLLASALQTLEALSDTHLSKAA